MVKRFFDAGMELQGSMPINENNIDMNYIPPSQSDTDAFMVDVVEVLWKNYQDEDLKLLTYKLFQRRCTGSCKSQKAKKSSKGLANNLQFLARLNLLRNKQIPSQGHFDLRRTFRHDPQTC